MSPESSKEVEIISTIITLPQAESNWDESSSSETTMGVRRKIKTEDKNADIAKFSIMLKRPSTKRRKLKNGNRSNGHQ